MKPKRRFKEQLGIRLYELPGFNKKILEVGKHLKEVEKALKEKKN